MEAHQEDHYSLADIVNVIKSLVRYLFIKWRWFLLAILTGAVIGTVYYNVQKPRYEAVSTFILEEKQSGMGGLSSIASQFGIDMGGLSGGGSIFAGDNILDILKSKKVVQQVLLSPINDTVPASQTLADLYLDFTGMTKEWQNNPRLHSLEFSKIEAPISTVQDSVLNLIYKGVVKKNLSAQRLNKKGTIIQVQVNAQNDCFARLMSERLVEEASKMYLSIKTGNALENIKILQHRSDSLLVLLNNKSYRAAASQTLDVNPGIRTASVPLEIAARDKTVIATLYTEVTKNLETSRMLLAHQTPVILLLDKPDLSLEDKRKGLLIIILISTFISFFISICFLSTFYILKRARVI